MRQNITADGRYPIKDGGTKTALITKEFMM